jgi:hypothetical protein
LVLALTESDDEWQVTECRDLSEASMVHPTRNPDRYHRSHP